MKLVAVSDIFGIIRCFEDLVSELKGHYGSVESMDPYGGIKHEFPSETEAYAYFQEHVGLAGYIEILLEHLRERTSSLDIGMHLLGFSVGASAVWAVSERMDFNRKTKGICFYSSQIRNMLSVVPKIDIDLYFPESEPSFDVSEVSAELSKKPRVSCFKTPCFHGFMNGKSQNYNASGYAKYIEMMKHGFTLPRPPTPLPYP